MVNLRKQLSESTFECAYPVLALGPRKKLVKAAMHRVPEFAGALVLSEDLVQKKPQADGLPSGIG